MCATDGEFGLGGEGAPGAAEQHRNAAQVDVGDGEVRVAVR
jgi:hypothetical protein